MVRIAEGLANSFHKCYHQRKEPLFYSPDIEKSLKALERHAIQKGIHLFASLPSEKELQPFFKEESYCVFYCTFMYLMNHAPVNSRLQVSYHRESEHVEVIYELQADSDEKSKYNKKNKNGPGESYVQKYSFNLDSISGGFYKGKIYIARTSGRFYQIRYRLSGFSFLEDSPGSRIARIFHIIQKRYRDPSFNVEVLAKESNLGRKQLYRLVKEETGESPSIIIRQIRLEMAKKLIKKYPEKSLEEIAFMTGYQKTSWFIRLFKQRHGVHPSEIKRTY
ncbi:AraC family transcriptional regulator [Balneolaceae bacterium ANBcel3]|nr:AraC family transcriptional regulator [Balneolaceae bacterium ANBcel3]